MPTVSPKSPAPESTQAQVPDAIKPAEKPAAEAHPHADKYGRIPYPGLKVDEDGEPTTKLTEIPKDFLPSKHQALKSKNFESEALYFEYRAHEYQAKADEMKARAEESRKLGNSADRAKAKRLLDMRRKIAELTAQLQADGVDVDALVSE